MILFCKGMYFFSFISIKNAFVSTVAYIFYSNVYIVSPIIISRPLRLLNIREIIDNFSEIIENIFEIIKKRFVSDRSKKISDGSKYSFGRSEIYFQTVLTKISLMISKILSVFSRVFSLISKLLNDKIFGCLIHFIIVLVNC